MLSGERRIAFLFVTEYGPRVTGGEQNLVSPNFLFVSIVVCKLQLVSSPVSPNVQHFTDVTRHRNTRRKVIKQAAGRGPSFVEWYHEKFQPDSPLTGDEYLSRAVVGRYLADGFRRLLDHLPPRVSVSCHVGEVLDVRRNGRGYELEFADNDGYKEEIRTDKILLATGHSRPVPGDKEKRYATFAAQHPGLAFIPFVYPVKKLMAPIPAGARVAMNGIGLTFIDAVLELTEGRGGRFVRSGSSLCYEPSGSEPLIIPFCRSGLPMTPKAHDLPPFMRPLTFLTPTAVAELRARTPGGKLDIERDLWPLVELEMELHYYRVAMGDESSKLEACGTDGAADRKVIDSYLQHHPSQVRFDYRQALDPVGARRFDERSEEHTSELQSR